MADEEEPKPDVAGEASASAGSPTEPTAGATSEPKADAATEPEADAAPKKKRKKAKAGEATTAADEKSASPTSGPPEKDDAHFGATKILASLPGAGTPDGEVLRDAWTAFEVGDYAKARELAGRIVRSEDAAVAAKAAEVLQRTGVDQVQIAFLVACMLAILTIAWIYVPH